MKEFICENCEYFRRHYVYSAGRYSKSGCGHCIYPMLKHRKPDTKACSHFIHKNAYEQNAEVEAYGDVCEE